MSAAACEHRFADAQALAADLAHHLAQRLQSSIGAHGLASLVVSGGKTPRIVYEHLCREAIDWGRVCVALADERWVDEKAEDSNARLVREVLLQYEAAAARFVGLKNAAPTPELGAVAAWETFARVPRPFTAVLLGMGEDGHTASLFPGSPNLARALEPNAPAACVAMRAPLEPRARLSLNLSALCDTREIDILIGGESKWAVYQAARQSGPPMDMPIRAVLQQQRAPRVVYWSP
jgi:6-phosphogluconolactonase